MTQPSPRRDAAVAGAALAGFLLCSLVASSGLPGWETAVFRAVNGLPGALLAVLWPPMQLGVRAAPFVAAAVALGLLRSWWPAATVAFAGTLAHALAQWWKAAGPARPRPPVLLADVVTRGGVPDSAGFPSSHAAVAAAVAVALAPWLPRWAGRALYAVAGLAALARVFVGVHLPVDVLGGAALGALVGGLARLATVRWRA